MSGTLILSLILYPRAEGKRGRGVMSSISTEWIVDGTCAGLRASGLAVVFEVSKGGMIGAEPDWGTVSLGDEVRGAKRSINTEHKR